MFAKVKMFFKRWRAQIRCAKADRLWSIKVACKNKYGDSLYTLVAPSGQTYGTPSVNFDFVFELLEIINQGIITAEVFAMDIRHD